MPRAALSPVHLAGRRLPRLLAAALGLTACSGAPVTGTDGVASDTSTGPAPDTDAATTGAATSPTPTGGAGFCGDGVQDPGELCDDGNFADNDDCTGECKPPACDDGRQDGSESAVDCGGGCSPCPDNSVCYADGDCASGLCSGKCVGLYPSCLQLHLYFASLPDGDYAIDPDGDGVTISVRCDMMNGGWTEVAVDDLGAPTGWSAGSPGSCGTLSDHLLGGAGQFGAAAATEKTFPLLGVPHTEVKAIADVIIIDSWEAESMILELDGQSVASAVCSQGIPGSCGVKDSQCGAGAKDGSLRLIGQRELPGDSATVRLSSSLDQPADDEAWGLDALAVQVR